MTSERWRRVESLYHAALALPDGERTAFLARECAGDEPLRRDVESLLAQWDASGFLARPAVAALSPAGGLTVGQRLGVYEIVSPLGAGGMGEVYRARDTSLPREVAIKILPTVFASDPGRLARFEREARVLASLTNPHIAAIYGVEPMGGSRALVLELVEGLTLADRIAAGPIAIADALRIAAQIADALDAAHEQGIVHRDLKPANVKLRPDGVVKVLDFGLAKITELDADRATAAPAAGSTNEGAIVGTVAYMSPEQARGQQVDKRTDVWAFGCVLYEMLTGKMAFTGKTASDVIANVLQREPEWADLPGDSPAPVRRLIERCLEKDPRRRLRDIGDARIDLHETTSPAPHAAAGARRRWPRNATAAAAVIAAAIAGVVIERARGMRSVATAAPARLAITLPPGAQLAQAGTFPLAMSPNGEYVAFEAASPSANGGPLYLRAIAGSTARLVADEAWYPFFSPDSEWLGFFQGSQMKKVSVHGGVPVTITDSPTSRGASWGDDGYIIFAPLSRAGLSRVPAAGGVSEVLTTLDKSRGETSHRQPFVLPGGRAVLYRAEGSTYKDGAIVLYSLDSKQQRVLVKNGGYQPTVVQSGQLLYGQPGGLMAAPLDLSTLQLTGAPAIVVEGAEMYSASRTGTIVYGVGATTRSTFVWVDRRGAVTALPAPAQDYGEPKLSHDGRRIVTGMARDIWTYDIGRDVLTRLTFEAANRWALWSPDDRQIIYASNRPGTAWDILSRAADGSGNTDVLLAGPLTEIPRDLSADGAWLMYSKTDPTSGQDLWLLPMHGKEPPRPFVQTRAAEMEPSFSPNGRWIAYASNESESGRMEVYVRPMSGTTGQWQISLAGGLEPVWARSGKELFFRNGEKMFVVDVITEPTFTAGKPRLLFEGKFALGPVAGAAYDVSADGQRFLMLKPEPPRPEPLNVLLNWSDELKRLTQIAR